jgi:hypothetical protein
MKCEIGISALCGNQIEIFDWLIANGCKLHASIYLYVELDTLWIIVNCVHYVCRDKEASLIIVLWVKKYNYHLPVDVRNFATNNWPGLFS